MKCKIADVFDTAQQGVGDGNVPSRAKAMQHPYATRITTRYCKAMTMISRRS